ncbi:MAG: hypothetical protein A2033_04110 [Bacteroidetes bacterium GWA2_31_9]|nr:MAG: hypothetical protein A2033_04110 [Bacteroidetes bacterium GWA2_31_9]
MKCFLLDTHTFIWFIEGDARISTKAIKIISNPEIICSLSVVSIWEIAIKLSIKKLELNQALSDIILKTKSIGLDILPIKPEYILKVEKLPFYHNDPFDRLLISHSMVEKIPIISKDISFKKYSIDVVW